MFFGNVLLTPGQEFREFSVLRPIKTENARGDIVVSDYEEKGTIEAVLASASHEERERYRQATHIVSHKIIASGVPSFSIFAGDILKYEGRRFFIAGSYNPLEMGHFTIYYCYERSDTR